MLRWRVTYFQAACSFAFLAAGCFGALAAAQDEPSSDDLAYFEKHIRPVLVKECYECHSAEADTFEGGLALDSRAGMQKGGETGPAVVPGSSRQSLLMKAIRQTDKKLQMPPDKKLPDDVIAQFETWISRGAPDPRDGPAAESVAREIDIEAGRKFWAFQAPVKPEPPEVKNADWAKSDIDRFLLAKLEAAGLEPVADADPRVLIRRLYFDLIGLPPTPEQAAAFEAVWKKDADAAIDAAVEELLASPRFGERWGRHWLDVARYAESTGQSTNFAYPHAWRYRDWVIDAFNRDLPYNDFIRAQLAGDLIDADDPAEKAANMVATGFLAIGPKSLNERDRRQFQADVADEQIDATFQAFQAVTLACARCHDHKFDPIEQKDYYAVAGIFRSTETCYGTIRVIQSNHPSSLIELPNEANAPTALTSLTDSRRESIESQIEAAREQQREQDDFIRRIFIGSRITQLQSTLNSYDDQGEARALAMGVREGRFKTDSALYIRGEVDQPSGTVKRGVPQVLTTKQPYINRFSSGRKQLADFIASEENPLTARVMANRVWLHLFGRGLVTTPDNFGASGQTPSHPELLDYLAVTFVENEWSVKKLITAMVKTRAYQMSTHFSEANFQADPDNELVWRMPLRRLEAEAMRDALLQVSGKLDAAPPTGSPVARNGEGAVNRFTFLRNDPSMTDEHRSIYLPIVRDQIPEMLSIFDFPDPSLIMGQRATTTIPAQSLFLMNNDGVIRLATATADDLMKTAGDDREKIIRAYELCYTRQPDDTEINAALHFLTEYAKTHSTRQTWAAFSQALFAGAEFAHR